MLASFHEIGKEGIVQGAFEYVVAGLPYVFIYRVDMVDEDELIAQRNLS